MLPGMSEPEITLADLWATGISPERHPFEHLRDDLRRAGIRSVADLATAEPGRRVHVAGLITHRQRPGTADGRHLPQPRGRDRACSTSSARSG